MLFNVFAIYFIIISQLTLYLPFGVGQTESTHAKVGEYFLDWKYIGPCESSKYGSNEIQMNVKLTKKNKRSQMMGNYTFLIPWDETIMFHLHLMRLGSNSSWIPNTYRWTLAGCYQYRLLLAGSRFLNHLNLPNKCPIPQGVYIMREYDADKVIEDASSLVPKTFFYGSYRIIGTIKKSEKVVGCCCVALDILPKWQRRNKTHPTI